MKVLLTIFPHHINAIPKLKWLMYGVAGGVVTGNIITSMQGEGIERLGSAISTGLDTGFIFADLQAEQQSGSIERWLAEHKIPGREGEVFQDMGGGGQPITISGKWIYENKPNDALQKSLDIANSIIGTKIGWNWVRLEIMKMLARHSMPMMLASNLFVGPVILKKFDFSEVGGQPNVYNYSLQLKEFNPALSLISSLGIGSIQVMTSVASRVISGISDPLGGPSINLGSGIVRGL